MKRRIVLSIVFLLLGVEALQAQISVNSSGDEASGEGGTLSYSLGQVMYSVASGSTGSIEQGIQQPLVTSVVSGSENTDVRIKSTAYPNPTANVLKLEVDNVDSFVYQLLDVKGNILDTREIQNPDAVINMKDLPQAIYLLKVSNSGNIVKTFRIIKN